MNRFLRAHFLAAEAADAFPVIIDRWGFSAVSEIHSFLRDRAALDADPAADALVWLDVWLLLKNIQSLRQTLPHTGTRHSPVYIKVWVPVLCHRILHTDRTAGRQKLNLSSFQVPSPIFSP